MKVYSYIFSHKIFLLVSNVLSCDYTINLLTQNNHILENTNSFEDCNSTNVETSITYRHNTGMQECSYHESSCGNNITTTEVFNGDEETGLNLTENTEEESNCQQEEEGNVHMLSNGHKSHQQLSFESQNDVENKLKTHICSICNKTFYWQYELKRHKRIHTGEKPYKCEHCGKCFTQRNNLNYHYQRHAGEKPHPCEICGKRFLQKGHLKAHLVVHTGEKPYKCDICGKQYSHSSALRSHLRIHNGGKQYICSICGSKFEKNQDLVAHVTVHHGEEQFTCQICGNCFENKTFLEQHSQIHLREDIVKCILCGKAFYPKVFLESHLHLYGGRKLFEFEIYYQQLL